MSNALDRQRINAKGGGEFFIRELGPTPSNTYLSLGYLDSSKLLDDPQMVGDPDEGGNQIAKISGGQDVKWQTTLKQSSIAEINLLRNAAGKFYEGYYAVTLENGNIQEISIPLLQIIPKLELAFAAATERKIPVEIQCLAPKAAYTRGVTTFNVVKNQPYIMIEGATATFNTSNTEASAMATAIL